MDGGRRQVKQRVNLSHRPIDPPSRPHLAPMENELLMTGRKFLHFGNFCHDRNRSKPNLPMTTGRDGV